MDSHVGTAMQTKEPSGDFLLSQIDARRVDETAAGLSDSARRALGAEFAGLLWGEHLRHEAMGRLAGRERFAALVIRPDGLDTAEDRRAEDAEAAGLLETARCLEEAGRRAEALWGIDTCGSLAAFLPEHTVAQALSWAEEFQVQVRSRTGRTVTIGAAGHPTGDYAAAEAIDNARKAADHAAFFGPGSRVAFDSVSLNISADILYENGDTAAAIQEYQRAIVLDPGNVNARNSLGVCYAVSGDYDRALAEFGEVVERECREYMAVYNIGLVHWLQGRKQTALEFLLKADALHADVFEVLFQTGRLYLEIGDPRSALDFLDRALRSEAKPASLYRCLGDCHAALAEPEKAIAAYRNAIRANPADSNALSALGALLHARGEDPEIALMFCRESVALEPDNALFRQRLGDLHLEQNRLAEALEEFEKAGSLGLDTTEAIGRVRLLMAGTH
jgi:tetratricopeptide (TPR) repeat protein